MPTTKENALESLDQAIKGETLARGAVARFLQERVGPVKPFQFCRCGINIRVVGIEIEPPTDSLYSIGLRGDDRSGGFLWAVEDLELDQLRDLVASI